MTYTNIILIFAIYYCLSGAICGTYKEFSYINQFKDKSKLVNQGRLTYVTDRVSNLRHCYPIPRIEFANDSLKKVNGLQPYFPEQRTINMQISLPANNS